MLGLIGKKIGMTQVFDENGTLTPVTVIKIEDNIVIGERKEEKEGYSAVILASIDKKKNVTKPYAGVFKNISEPKKFIREMRDFDQEVAVGDVLGVDLFKDTVYVDVTGTSKGKGYQGAMKRWGFGGGRKTHGSKFHRALGGTGMSSTPSRTFPGQKMAGHMGDGRVTVQNLRVVGIDSELKVILVKGAVPGANQGTVIVRKAVKK